MTLKYNPGFYLMTNVSYKYSEDERSERAIKFINALGSDENIAPYYAGIWQHPEWNGIQKNHKTFYFDRIERELDACAKHGLHYYMQLVDRKFSSGTVGSILPDNLDKYGWIHDKDNSTWHGAVWEDEYVDTQLTLLQALGKRFDNHEYFELVHFGESSVSLTDKKGRRHSLEKYTANLIDLIVDGKTFLPNTTLDAHLNFLGENSTESKHMLKMLAAVSRTRGTGVSNPDTVVGRLQGYKGKYDGLGYGIALYELLDRMEHQFSVNSHIEMHDMRSDQVFSSIMLALNNLHASRIAINSVFTSRRQDGVIQQNDFIKHHVTPAIKSVLVDHFGEHDPADIPDLFPEAHEIENGGSYGIVPVPDPEPVKPIKPVVWPKPITPLPIAPSPPVDSESIEYPRQALIDALEQIQVMDVKLQAVESKLKALENRLQYVGRWLASPLTGGTGEVLEQDVDIELPLDELTNNKG